MAENKTKYKVSKKDFQELAKAGALTLEGNSNLDDYFVKCFSDAYDVKKPGKQFSTKLRLNDSEKVTVFDPSFEDKDKIALEDYKTFFGREYNAQGFDENNEKEQPKLLQQYSMEMTLGSSICKYYEITKDQLRMIRELKDKETPEKEQVVAKLKAEKPDVKPEEVNTLFDKCNTIIMEHFKKEDNKKLEHNGNGANDQPAEQAKEALKDQIANMTKVGEEGKKLYEVRIEESRNNSKNYIFSDPKTILQKYIANSLKRNSGKIKYYNKDGAEIKFADEENNSILDDDYKELFGGADKDTSNKGDTANDQATKEDRKSVRETMVTAICKFYGKSVEDLVGIVKKEETSRDENEQGIFNLFNECKSILDGEKNLVESKEEIKEEGKDKKECYKIEGITWTDEAKKQAVKDMSKNQDRKNLNYENLSFEELNIRLKDITGRSFDQIIKGIADFVRDNDHNDKWRLNDALFGTGAFNPDPNDKKKVKRKLRATVWFKKLFAKENDEYPLNENDSKGKTPSVLKPNERKSHVVDMARGTFDACLRRMIHLAPNVFDNKNIGIKLKKKEGHFARNLGKVRLFSSKWIRESFDLSEGTRGETSLFFGKPTKKSFFQKIADAYLKTPALQKLLHDDTMEIGVDQNKKYTIGKASGKIKDDLKYDKDAKEISIIDEHDNIIKSKLKEVSLIELQNQNKELQNQLQEANKANGDKDNKIKLLEEGGKAALEKSKGLQDQLDAAQNEKTQLQGQLNTAQTEKEQALRDKETAEEQAKDLQEQVNAARDLKKREEDFNKKDAALKELGEILSKYQKQQQGGQQGEQKEITINKEDVEKLTNCLAAMGMAQQQVQQQ